MNKNVPSGFHSAMAEAFKEVEATQRPVKTGGRAVKTVVAVLMCITLVSVTAFAANEIYNKWFKKTGEYSGKIIAEDVSFQTAPENVAFEFGYLPDEFTVFEAPYKYHYKGEFGLSFNLWKMSSVDTNEYKNIVATEETVFGGNQAQILTIKGSEAKLALIYFENMGTVVECYYNKSIPQVEVKKVLDGLKLKETTEDNALIYDGTNTGTSQPWVDDTKLPVRVCDFGSVYEYDYDIATGAQYTVKVLKTEILDNVNSMDKNCIWKDFTESEYIDEKGYLKDYVRENIIYGDGVNTVDVVESTELVGRKIVAVTVEVENVNNTDGEFYSRFPLCNEAAELVKAEQIAVSGQDGTSNRMYFVNMSAGEKKTVTVYNIVDADIDFDDLYVFMQHHDITRLPTEQVVLEING